jgi:hypothetical protein
MDIASFLLGTIIGAPLLVLMWWLFVPFRS